MPTTKQKEETCKVEWLAKVSGLTSRWIQKLTDEGTVPKIGRGEYPKERALTALFAYLRAQAGGVTAQTQLDKARQQKAEADKAEVDAMLAIDSAVLASDVDPRWEDAATKSRVVIETYPGLTEAQRDGIISRLAAIKLSAEEES